LKHITLSNGEKIESRTVIMAGGVEFRSMKFPGSEGPGVIIGDGKALAKAGAGGNVCVVGGSNGAAQAALGCAAHCQHVYLMSRSAIQKSMSAYQIDAVKNNKKVEVIEGDSIAQLVRDDEGNPWKLETVNGRTLPVRAVGEFLGSLPDTKWVPPDITLAKGGRVPTNRDFETDIPGVYAVGDMRDGAIGRIGVAVGEGQFALRQAYMHLEQQAPKTKAASDKPAKPSTSLITQLFDLDRDNPWFGQTVEGVTPLKVKKAYDPNEPRNPHGEWTSGGDDDLGSMALGGPERNVTESTRKVDALREEMGVNLNDVPVEQRQALDAYTQDSNPFNREGTLPKETENLDKLVGSYELPRAMTVYRTVGWNRTQDLLNPRGDAFSDSGFMSATLDKSKIDKPGSYIEIRVPKGAHAFPVGSLSNYPEEAEILFPRDTKLQIVSHEPRDAPQTERFVARLVS
jgi:hypothetical protein